MLKSPTKIEYEFSLLNVCSDGVISSMKHEMFWLLLLSLGGLGTVHKYQCASQS